MVIETIFKDDKNKLERFGNQLKNLLNQFGVDTETNIPDYILKDFLINQINLLNDSIIRVDNWYDIKKWEDIDELSKKLK